MLIADLAGLLAGLAIPGLWIGLGRLFFGFLDRRFREQLLAQFPTHWQ